MAWTGEELLKTILQLIRYDIPPLIVGKSSIGKSYTIIELTKRWRMPNDILYIGSEKPENIEGLAKLIDAGYGGEGEEILKFLKPYWFPNNNTITSQVVNGRDIFKKFKTSWTNKSVKYGYTYNCLHLMLISLMGVKFPEDKNEINIKLTDDARSYLSDQSEPQVLNEKPFTFKRTQTTKTQAETNVESTLPPSQAGIDEVRDLCMYLTTVLGYGNYWLILDELDKVDKYSQDKYAPLLHIVRERTLKNWTIQPINDKEGLNIPMSIEGGYYTGVAESIDRQIEAGLPLLDTRVIAIGNASDKIEEALFRRFIQIIMEDTMALYPSADFTTNIKNCVAQNFSKRNLLDAVLLKRLAFLDDVNLAWQYSFLPKMFNQGDISNNYFYKDFKRYYNDLKKRYQNVRDRENVMEQGELLDKTAIGKIFDSNFTGGGKVAKNPDETKSFAKFLYCVVEAEWIEEQKTAASIGELSPEGTTQTAVGKRRALITKMYSENPDLFWDKIESSIIKGFDKTKEGQSINPGAVSKWLGKSLLDIQASNENNDGEYNQLPEIGGKMIAFVYGKVIKLMSEEKLIDADLFDSLSLQMNKFFDNFLNKSDQSPEGILTVPQIDAQTLLWGGEVDNVRNSESQGFDEAENSLFGLTGDISEDRNYYNSLSFRIYINKYFKGEFPLFMKYTLGDAQSFMDFMKAPYSKNVINFLQVPDVQFRLEQIIENAKAKGKITRAMKNLVKNR